MTHKTAFTLTGFADEISPLLPEQIETFKSLRLQALDIRSVDGVNVLQLSDEKLREVRAAAEANELGIQAVGSPVNKVDLTPENRIAELGKLKRAIEAAHILGTRRIRIFTPETPELEHDSAWGAIQEWMGEQIALAKDADVLLIHENDAKFWGAYPKNAKRLFAEFDGPHFKAAFDFANTVLLGFHPLGDWFPWILPYLDTIHIKDAIRAEGKVVPAGKGDGQLREVLAYVSEEGWSGPLTLEPHLAAAGPLGGFSGAQLFRVAAEALREVLDDAGVEIE